MTKIINKNFILTAITFAMFFVAPVAFAVSYGPTVETLGPSDITEHSATLHAFFTSRDAEYDMSRTPILAFEYGQSSSLGTLTKGQPQQMGATTESYTIDNLEEGEVYYYRAVLYTDDAVIKGDKLKFETLSETRIVNSPLPTTESNKIIDTTVSSTNSNSNSNSSLNTSSNNSNSKVVAKDISSGSTHLSLSIDNNVDDIDPGDIVTYEINYENISNTELENATLVIEVPEEMHVMSTSGARLIETRSGYTARLGDLKPGEKDTIKITGRMRGRSADDQIIARTNIMYGIGSVKNAETASAFDIDDFNGLTNVALGATAFGAGFFPTGLGGWLIVIAIIILIVFIVHRFYLREPEEEMAFQKKYNPPVNNPEYTH